MGRRESRRRPVADIRPSSDFLSADLIELRVNVHRRLDIEERRGTRTGAVLLRETFPAEASAELDPVSVRARLLAEVAFDW
jgi:hypothetical protein